MDTEEGVTLPTGFSLSPTPPEPDFSKLRENKDPNWARQAETPFASFRRATLKVLMHYPSAGQPSKSIADEWLCFSNGERFTNESLGYVSDIFPMVVEAFREENPYDVSSHSKPNAESKGKKDVTKVTAAMWYPTLNLNLDMKKPLPKEGVEWLFVRAATKVVKNGRLDLEIVILDEEGEVVALSHHTTLAVAAARNTSKRSHDTSKI
jgi:hypothetical protein